MRIREIIYEAKFLGTCVNAFDEDGDCTIQGLYQDTTDFAQHEANAKEISAQQFMKDVGPVSPDLDKQIGPHRIYLLDPDNQIYMILDLDADVHYFFKG